ncbi:MAG: CHASE2 domain-containing protein, partial [Gemmatimonadota bacterium]|nr:CHASE2 domain-containing protein [Gemmatimonadota bacterium]
MEGARRRRLAGAGERLAARWRRRQRAKVVLLVLAGLLAAGGALALYWTESLQRLELDTLDARFGIRGERDPPRNLIVVAIDSYTFGSKEQGGIGVRWQDWPRTYHARVIRNLKRDGARVIAYDVQFTEASGGPRGEEEDLALYDAADAARPVVFATDETDEAACRDPRRFERRQRSCTNVLGGEPNLRAIRARAGQALFIEDPQGVIRRMSISINGLKLFGVVTAEVVTGKRIDRLPGGEKTTWIDYAGPSGTLPSVSFSRVHYGRFRPGTFRGKIVVVGPVTPDLQDVHATSAGGGNMPGAEIQANSIQTALAGFPLRSAREAWDVLAIIVLSLLAPLASLRLAPLRVALVAVGGALA